MAENGNTDKVADESRGSESTAATTHSTVTKQRKKRSRAWDFFEEKVDAKGNNKYACRFCGQEYFETKGKSTTQMNNHIDKCPKNPYKVEKGQKLLQFQTLPGGNKGGLIPWKFDQEECRMTLCRMVIVDELPFSFVEKEGFRNFMKVAQPCFHIPSRTTVTRDCFALFNVEKNKLMKFLKGTSQRVSLTTDTWTSIQKINYMCITTHWIDSEWIMHKRIINFSPITSHKGEDMARCIIDYLREWGLQKIFTVTVDNASSNDVTVEKLSDKLDDWGTNSMNGQHLHMRCMTHIVNLIVKDGLKESSISIARVRCVVRYIRQSPARLRKFQECCESENIVKKSLCLDVPTRWNSTYLMLSRAIEYERAIKEYSDRDTGLSRYLMFDAISDGKPVGILTRTDWDEVKRIAQFLEIFYNLTLKVSGSLYVTSNSHFLEIGQVVVYLNRLITTEDELLSEMASSMWKKFEKYWGEPKKMNKMIFIACVLDPRYKFTTVSFVLKKMFGDEGTIIEKEVHTYMSSLFNEYVSKSVSKDTGGKVSTSLPSSSFSTMETSTPGLGELLDEIRKHKAASGGVDSKTELEKYLAEDPENERPDFDILAWWKVNSPRFPILGMMARDVLAIPISSVASESAFSTGGRILDQFRSSLTPKLVETLVCLQDWLRSESLPINVEEDLDFLETLEEGMYILINFIVLLKIVK